MKADNVHGIGLADTYAASSLRRGGGDRLASAALGLVVAAVGWRRGGLLGALGLVAGGALLWRSVAGRWPGLAGDSRAARARPMEPGASASVALDRGVGVEERVVIDRPAAEVYAFFRDLPNLARVMDHVERVEVSSSALSHWTVRGPAGVRFEWDSELIVDRPGERVAWRSREGSEVRSAGSVHFVPLDGDRAEVRVRLKYEPPAGALGDAVARLLGDSPAEQLREDLGRLKQALEQGPIDPAATPG